MLRGEDGSEKLCFSRTGGSDRLRLRAVGNGSSTEEESADGDQLPATLSSSVEEESVAGS